MMLICSDTIGADDGIDDDDGSNHPLLQWQLMLLENDD